MTPPTTASTWTARCVQRWLAALSPEASADKAGAFLVDAAATLGAAMRRAHSIEGSGQSVGVQLVDAGFCDPRTVDHVLRIFLEEWTTQIIGERLPDSQALVEHHRAAALAAAIADGFARALRDRAATVSRDVETRDPRFEAVFSGAAVGIGVLGLDGVINEVNTAMAGMLGTTAESIRGRTIAEIVGEAAWGEEHHQFRKLVLDTTTKSRFETLYTKPDGDITHLDLSLTAVLDESGSPQFVVGVAVDVTERRLLQDRMWHDSRHDPLTGLPNRTLLLERLADARGPLVLCSLHLDGFKNVNHTLGHEAGDLLLVTVARRLSDAAVRSGGSVCRSGGGSFAVVYEGREDSDDIADDVEALLATVELPVRHGATDIRITARIGVACSSAAGTQARRLLQAADLALYQAKSATGKRWARYDASLGAGETTRRTIAASLLTSLDRGEFSLNYQPLVDLATERVIGVEALARWKHPDLGNIPPDVFVPIAEKNGHIFRFGQWVLDTACAQADRWNDVLGGSFYTSVNVSAMQLNQPGFARIVLSALERWALSPDRVQLELTETAVAGDIGCAVEAMRELADEGVRLAIDDFGTGYSNLAHLSRLPVHQLKLDRSLTELTESGDELAYGKIVAAAISLAQSLSLSVVSEGVETAAQAELLRRMGCDHAQGWLYGRPVPAAEVEAVARRSWEEHRVPHL